MLTAKEIEQFVKGNQPLPKYADCYEKFYYHALSVGVELFRQKKISREKLRDYRNIYEEVLLWNRLIDNHRKIEMKISKCELGECEYCKTIAKYLDRREYVE